MAQAKQVALVLVAAFFALAVLANQGPTVTGQPIAAVQFRCSDPDGTPLQSIRDTRGTGVHSSAFEPTAIQVFRIRSGNLVSSKKDRCASAKVLLEAVCTSHGRISTKSITCPSRCETIEAGGRCAA